MRGMVLHGLSFRDAAMVGLAFMEQAYPEESKRMAEWKRLAKACGILVEEDPVLKAQRHKRMMEQVAADFGGDG